MKKEEKENAGAPEIDRPGRMPVKEVGGKSSVSQDSTSAQGGQSISHEDAKMNVKDGFQDSTNDVRKRNLVNPPSREEKWEKGCFRS